MMKSFSWKNEDHSKKSLVIQSPTKNIKYIDDEVKTWKVLMITLKY
jgi:hypothetical protein